MPAMGLQAKRDAPMGASLFFGCKLSEALGLSNIQFSSVIGYTVYEATPGSGASFTAIPGPDNFTFAAIFPISTFRVYGGMSETYPGICAPLIIKQSDTSVKFMMRATNEMVGMAYYASSTSSGVGFRFNQSSIEIYCSNTFMTSATFLVLYF